MDLPIPTPPPWWTLTHVAPAAVLRSALRMGQSAMASEPSCIASVSRYGEATEPADASGKPLEGDKLRSQLEPLLEEPVVRKELTQHPVDCCDVLRVAGEHGPAEGTDASAEERPDIGRDEARVCERILDACL